MTASRGKLDILLGTVDWGSGRLGRYWQGHPAARITVVASSLATLIAVALIPVRDSVGTANIGLLLGIVVAITGSRGGIGPGLATAVWSSVLFALLHSVPHGLPRIEDEQDAATALLLLVAGGLAGWFHRRAVRLEHRVRDSRYELQRLHQVAEAAAGPSSTSEVIDVIADAVSAELRLADCYWEPGPGAGPWRELHHNGLIDGLGHDADPETLAKVMSRGVAIDLGAAGRLVLIGRQGARPSPQELQIGVILADYGAALLKLGE